MVKIIFLISAVLYVQVFAQSIEEKELQRSLDENSRERDKYYKEINESNHKQDKETQKDIDQGEEDQDALYKEIKETREKQDKENQKIFDKNKRRKPTGSFK